MTRPELIERVKVLLNEMLPKGEGLEGLNLDEPTPVNDYIDSFLDDSAQEVLLLAPAHLCPIKTYALSGTNMTDPPIFELFSDYLRLVELNFASWEHPVTEFHDPIRHQKLYRMNKNQFVKGGSGRPMAFLISKNVAVTVGETTTVIAKRYIEVYTVPYTLDAENEKVFESINCIYIPVTNAEDCGSRVQLVIAWLTAAKVLSITNRPESKIAFELYKRELELLNQ